MPLMCQKLYSSTGAGTGANASIASADIPADAVIRGVLWAIDAVDAAGASGHVELSFNSASSIGTNDTRSQISGTAYYTLTSNAVNLYHDLSAGYRAAGGDRIFLHNNNTAAFDTLRITCYVFMESSAGAGRSRKL